MWNFPPFIYLFYFFPASYFLYTLLFSYLWTRSSPWNLSHIRGVERELKKESGKPVEPILPRKERYLFAIHPPTGRKLGSRTCLEFFSLPNRTYGIWDRWWTRAELPEKYFHLRVGRRGTQTKKYGNNLLQWAPSPEEYYFELTVNRIHQGMFGRFFAIIHLESIYLHSY